MSEGGVEHVELLDDVPRYCESLILKYILNVGWAVRLRRVIENLTYHSLCGDLERRRLADRHDVKLSFQFS